MNKFENIKRQQEEINARHLKAVEKYFKESSTLRDKLDQAIKAFTPIYLHADQMNRLPSATEQDRIRYLNRRDHMDWILEQRRAVDRYSQELYSAIYKSI